MKKSWEKIINMENFPLFYVHVKEIRMKRTSIFKSRFRKLRYYISSLSLNIRKRMLGFCVQDD